MKTCSYSYIIFNKNHNAFKFKKKNKKKNSWQNFDVSRRQSFIFLVTLYIMSIFSFAQDTSMEIDTSTMPPPGIELSYPNKSLAVGDCVIVEIVIPEKWHVNANVVSDEFLKASQIEIAAKGIVFNQPIWPTYKKKYNDALEMDIFVFDGKIQIKIPIKELEASYDSTTTNTTFHYQACSNFICLAPNQVHFSLSPSAATPIPIKKNDSSILVLLFFAFIGGFILNLMPCVLPVLSLKLFSLIKQSGKSRKRLFTLGLSMTGGILFSFWILATIIISLKSAGSLVGWGIQFQSIGFIAFMVILLSAFAMNFFGFFEIWLPGKTLTKMDGFTKKEGLAGAFFTGSLLVLLSTPCSAPFLGSAMGFAFSASAPVLFLFFTVAGLGLSLPYLIITLFPVLLSIFPKPGPWMVSLQKWMGLLLLGTVLWLLWVAKQTVGLEGFFLLIILSLMSMGFSFLTGKIAPPYKPFYREILLLLSSVLILFFTWQFAVSPTIDKALKEKKAAAFSLEKDESGFFPYSKEHLTSALEAGQPVLLDITADWCLTCKANEAAVLSQESLGYVLDKHNVVKIKADWTLQDKEISELLKSLGRSGVPVYAIYLPHNPQNPILLPEILTTNSILDVLDSNQ